MGIKTFTHRFYNSSDISTTAGADIEEQCENYDFTSLLCLIHLKLGIKRQEAVNKIGKIGTFIWLLYIVISAPTPVRSIFKECLKNNL